MDTFVCFFERDISFRTYMKAERSALVLAYVITPLTPLGKMAVSKKIKTLLAVGSIP